MTTLRRRPLVPHAMPCGLFLLAAVATATAQCPPTRIVSPEGAGADRFGGWMATNMAEGGNQWVVGELNQVWAYDLVDGQLVQRQDLRIPRRMTHHLFGQSVAMEHDRLVIGSYFVDWPDRDRSVGGAFVYELADGLWTLQAELEPPKDLGSSGTGSLVALDRDTIFASGGALREVIVYVPSATEPGQWSAVQVIEGDRDDQFGFPIAAGGGWLFVSASRDDTHTFAGGSVIVYRRQADGTYARTQTIDGPPLATYRIQLFGSSLDFDGQTLAIGAGAASPEIEDQGAVYIFELEDDLWTLRQTLTHRGAEPDDTLGYLRVCVDGDRMLVRADDERTARSDSAVYAFERTASGTWRQATRPLPVTPLHARLYGRTMALGGDLALIGALSECEPGSTDETGAAYLFDLSCYECPDLDADDVLTVFDSLEFLRAFEAGEAIADFDNDGSLTIADFLAFQDAFAVGCP